MLYYFIMTKNIKLDLHTHPIEALKAKMGIKGIGDINKDVAATLVKAIKSAGLNGIAITEHQNFNHGWVAALEIMDHFQRESLIILPGSEIDYQGQQFLQIYIPDFYRRHVPFFKGREWFMVFAHPGYYNPLDREQIYQIQFDAVEGKNIHGEFPVSEQISRERSIPTIKSSDAHKLEDLGMWYTEMEMH